MIARPKIAVIDPNTLAAMGLKQILQNVMPIMTVDTYGSFLELLSNQPDDYFHYFVSINIVLENKAFFLERRRKTIVLTLSLDTMSQLSILQQKILTDREIEVMALIVQGYINKEIAERLNISMATVITHRKNIMDKLGIKSVSALTIYAVTHGYVDINKI